MKIYGEAQNKEAQEKEVQGRSFTRADVKVHYNSPQPKRQGALAYTQGCHIYLAPGREKALPHELGHVIQQMQGRVAPTHWAAGQAVNRDAGLEAEAGRLGCRPFPALTADMTEGEGTIQCFAFTREDVMGHAAEKGLHELGGKLAGELMEILNQTATDMEAGPERFLGIDPILDRLAAMQEEMGEDFGAYADGTAFTLRHLEDMTLDISPTHVMQTDGSIQKEPGYQHKGLDIMKSLNQKQLGIYLEQVSVLQEYCKTEGIESVIKGAAINVKRSWTLLDYQVAGVAAGRTGNEVFVNRLRLMTDYIKKVGNRQLTGSNPPLTIKDKYYIQSTGSDPHANGAHALFLIDKENENNQMLYKPHSLKLEDAILGRRGLVDQMYESSILFWQKDNLPIMGFDTEGHTEDFIHRTGDVAHPLPNMEQARKQYYKLGMLEAIMRVAGITDLHAENIMFTERGPIPIDAECGGIYGETGITHSGDGPGEIDERRTYVNPSALYVRDSGGRIWRQSQIPEQVQAGTRHMASRIVSNKSKFMRALNEGLSRVDSYRVVPFTTSQLAIMLETYIINRNKIELARQYVQAAQAAMAAVNSDNLDDRVMGFQEAAGRIADIAEIVSDRDIGKSEAFNQEGSENPELCVKAADKAVLAAGKANNALEYYNTVLKETEMDADEDVNLYKYYEEARNTTIQLLDKQAAAINEALEAAGEAASAIDIEGLCAGTYPEALQEFNDPKMAYYKKGVTNVELDKSRYIKFFSNAMREGTLPAFSVQMNPDGNAGAGAILLDDQPIGQIQYGEDKHDITADEMRQNYKDRAERELGIVILEMLLMENLGNKVLPDLIKKFARENYDEIKSRTNSNARSTTIARNLVDKLNLNILDAKKIGDSISLNKEMITVLPYE